MKPEEIKVLASLHEMINQMNREEMTMTKVFATGMAVQARMDMAKKKVETVLADEKGA